MADDSGDTVPLPTLVSSLAVPVCPEQHTLLRAVVHVLRPRAWCFGVACCSVQRGGSADWLHQGSPRVERLSRVLSSTLSRAQRPTRALHRALRDRPVHVDARGCLSVAKGGYVSRLIFAWGVQEPYFADFTKTAAGKRYLPPLP